MKYLIQFILCGSLILFKTSLFPFSTLFKNICDLMCPLVVYLGLFQPIRTSLPLILVTGFIMDNLSGAPMGLHISTYVWIFLGAAAITKYIHLNNMLVWLLMVGVAVMIQNLFFGGVTLVADPNWRFESHVALSVAKQAVWGALLTPFLFRVFDYVFSLDIIFGVKDKQP